MHDLIRERTKVTSQRFLIKRRNHANICDARGERNISNKASFSRRAFEKRSDAHSCMGGDLSTVPYDFFCYTRNAANEIMNDNEHQAEDFFDKRGEDLNDECEVKKLYPEKEKGNGPICRRKQYNKKNVKE